MSLFEENFALWKNLLPKADRYLSIDKIDTAPLAPEHTQSEITSFYESLQLGNHQCLIIYGLEDGFLYRLLIPWLESNPDHFVIFAEDNSRFLCSFLATELASRFLRDKQAYLIFGNTEDDFRYFLHLISVWKYDLHIYFRALPRKSKSKAASLQALARFIWLRSKENAIEYRDASSSFVKNTYQNIYLLPESKDYSHFINAFKGIPAIIAGAGPSLSLNRHLLPELKDRALLIGGGTSINALNAGNVQPHLGVGIDPNPSFYNRILSSTAWEVPFIYYYRMYHPALSLVHGDKIFTDFAPGISIPKWLHKQLGASFDITIAKEMFNVINFATLVAVQLGCNPILFVGIDLAYTGDASYAAGLKGVASQVSSTSFTTKTASEEVIIREDIFGKPIKTLWKWALESLWYSKLKLEYPGITFINCTEGGLGFYGVQNQTLEEASKKYCNTSFSIEDKVDQLLDTSKRCTEATPQQISQVLETLEASFQRCEAVFEKVQEQLTTLKWENLDLICLQEIAEEPAYQHLIRAFDDFMQLQFRPSFARLDTFRSEIGEETYFTEKEHLQRKRLKRILKVIKFNLNALKEAIEAPHLSAMNVPKVPVKRKTFENNVLKTFYPDGTPKSIIPFSDGYFDGEVLLYYHNGALSRKLHYEKGLKHGSEEVWNRGGQIILQAEYLKNTPVGIAREWHFNGVLARECVYGDDGSIQSVQNWDKKGDQHSGKEYHQELFSQVILLENALKAIVQQVKLIPAFQAQFEQLAYTHLQRVHKLRETLTPSKDISKDTGESLGESVIKPKEIEKEIQILSQGISDMVSQMQQQIVTKHD